VPNGLMVRTDLNQYKLGSSVARLYTRETASIWTKQALN